MVRRMQAKGLRQQHTMVSSPERSRNGIPVAGIGCGLGQSEEGSSGGVLTQSITEGGHW
jgi:hypothetical protein